MLCNVTPNELSSESSEKLKFSDENEFKTIEVAYVIFFFK